MEEELTRLQRHVQQVHDLQHRLQRGMWLCAALSNLVKRCSNYYQLLSCTEQSRYKTLKANYDELEKGFTAKSDENMRLATELETASYSNSMFLRVGDCRRLTAFFPTSFCAANAILSPQIAMLGRQLNEARRAAAGGGRTVSTTSSTMPSPFLQQAEATQTQWNEDAQQSVSVQAGGRSLPSSPIDPSKGEGSEEVEALRVQLRELNMQKAQLLQTVGHKEKAGMARLSAQERGAMPVSPQYEEKPTLCLCSTFRPEWRAAPRAGVSYKKYKRGQSA